MSEIVQYILIGIAIVGPLASLAYLPYRVKQQRRRNMTVLMANLDDGWPPRPRPIVKPPMRDDTLADGGTLCH